MNDLVGIEKKSHIVKKITTIKILESTPLYSSTFLHTMHEKKNQLRFFKIIFIWKIST